SNSFYSSPFSCFLYPEAFSDAFKKIYNIDYKIDWKSVQGMTDQEIIIQSLLKNGLRESIISEKMKDCINEMVDSFNKSINQSSIEPMDGVVDLLNELDNKDVILGLVTGNLEPIARAKMRKVGLNDYFKIGGFGNDDEERVNLIKIAIDRAKRGFNFKFENNVFLFGDTPQDIKAGKGAGIKTIGVATGIYSKEELENTNADFVFMNLKDKNKILGIILLEK
ncbi:unnamed protein product, partial [marine sediment metagenome]